MDSNNEVIGLHNTVNQKEGKPCLDNTKASISLPRYLHHMQISLVLHWKAFKLHYQKGVK